MSKIYLNKDLVLDGSKKFVQDEKFLKDAQYFINKECGFVRKEEEIEERRKEELDNDDEYSIKSLISNFKINFSKIMGKKILSLDDFNYRHYASEYLLNTFPYSLFTDDSLKSKNLECALLFYAKNNLCASDKQLEYLIPILKCIPMHYISHSSNNSEYSTELICYSNIVGTTVEKYYGESVYDTLLKFDNDTLFNFINYLLVSDGLKNPPNILYSDHTSFFKDNNKFYVVEGNHRFLIAKALYEIGYYITLNCFTNNKLFYAKVLKKTP